jgi:hypothetical protein
MKIRGQIEGLLRWKKLPFDGVQRSHKYYFLCFLIKKTFIKILIAPSGIFFHFSVVARLKPQNKPHKYFRLKFSDAFVVLLISRRMPVGFWEEK